jgi:beta-phosphoglucomutase
MIEACIFDLDGVVVDTARYHFLAWRRLANHLGFDFTEEENEKLKGVGRMESLEIILGWGGLELDEHKKFELAELKNGWYREYISEMDASEILEGVMPFLDELQNRGIRVGLGSSSKNARQVVERIGLMDTFEVIVDGTMLTRSKPDPQVFLLAAEAMRVDPAKTIVFEDAESGVEAALNGGFFVVGVGDPQALRRADMIIPGFKDLTVEDVLEGISDKIKLQ